MPELDLVQRELAPQNGADHVSEGARPLPIFDERFGIRFGARRYYVNVRIGAELRCSGRLADEGQVRVSGIAFLYLVICSGTIMLFGTLCLLYLLKSGMGLNLFDDESMLHPLFELMDR